MSFKSGDLVKFEPEEVDSEYGIIIRNYDHKLDRDDRYFGSIFADPNGLDNVEKAIQRRTKRYFLVLLDTGKTTFAIDWMMEEQVVQNL